MEKNQKESLRDNRWVDVPMSEDVRRLLDEQLVSDTYFDAVKITQKPVKVVDGLTETYTTIFKDESSCNEFLSDGDANDTHFEELQKWCTDNSISWSIEKE